MLLTATGCKKEKEPEIVEDKFSGEAYIEKIKSFKPREKRTDGAADDAKFDEFLDKVFKESVESDYLNMHFSVKDYKKMGIEKPEVTLGEVVYGQDEEGIDYMLDQVKELLSYDYSKLSRRQQFDYDALEYSIYETLAELCYYQYGSLFSSGSCVPENLTSNFTDFVFYDQESIEDYLILLQDIDRYFDDALKYTADQAADGHGMLDSWIEYSQEACDGVLNKTEDNEYIVSFQRRLDELDFLTDAQKADYIAKNRKIVLEEVLPSYKKVRDELEQYKGKVKNEDFILANLDKNYAELTFMLKGSNNYSIDTIFQQLKDNLDVLESEYFSCYYDKNSFAKLEQAMDGDWPQFELTGRDCLEYLRTSLKAYFPDLGDVDYTVDELDPDTAPDTAIAYYWPSPVDDYNQNMIKVNPNNMREGFETYGTLAHEGFPGHLYQHVYYYKTNPHNFRSVLSFIGYTEGWAVNATYYAYRFCGIEDDYAASALFFEDSYYFLVYSIIDIATNYYGMTAKEISEMFEKESRLLNVNTKMAKELRSFMIEMPGVYCSYGIGLSNFMTMAANAQREAKNFDFIKYHGILMENGPLPFNILQTAVDQYVAESK